jgi:hypothetical protein
MSGTSRLARIARLTAKIVIGLIAVLIVIVAVLFIVNSFDVPLSDQAKALLTPPPNPYSPEENIYLAMAGMEGPGERPIVELGQERIDAYNKKLDSVLLNPDTFFSLDNPWGASRLKLNGKLEPGSPRSTSIWAGTKTHRPEIADLLVANQQLYQRYLSLHHFRGYYETARPSYLAPLVFSTPQIRTVFLGNVADRIQTGTPPQQREALAELQRDLQLWRMVLKGDGTLISKMLSVAFIHQDLLLLADLITDPSFNSTPLEDALDPMLLPFDTKDFAIGNTFAAEFRGTEPLYKIITAANQLPDATASSSWHTRIWKAIQVHYFKLNDTENRSAELAARYIALDNSKPAEFERNWQSYRKWLEKDGPQLALNYLYNPIGKILASLSVANVADYYRRVFDVAAYQHLAYLVFQLKRQHIATADVASFMEAHPEWSAHPVDGKPFSWNAETGELAVNTLGPHPKEQRFSVILR